MPRHPVPSEAAVFEEVCHHVLVDGIFYRGKLVKRYRREVSLGLRVLPGLLFAVLVHTI